MHADQALHDQIRSFMLLTFPAAKKRAIDDDFPLIDSGIIDSLGTLDVVAFVEHSFGIEVSDDDLTPENFASIRALATFVLRKTGVPAE